MDAGNVVIKAHRGVNNSMRDPTGSAAVIFEPNEHSHFEPSCLVFFVGACLGVTAFIMAACREIQFRVALSCSASFSFFFKGRERGSGHRASVEAIDVN